MLAYRSVYLMAAVAAIGLEGLNNVLHSGLEAARSVGLAMAPSIAVITVCRNHGTLLPRAVDSVARLADPRVRHIVIDGASTDGTVEYLQTNGQCLHYWLSEPDRGIYDAMNKGWNAAPENSYVIFLGADDQLLALPSTQEIEAARDAGISVIYGTTDVGDLPFRSRWDSGIRFRNTVHHQSMAICKSVAPTSPFDDRYRVYGDWDFNLRLWRRGVKAAYSPSLRALADAGGASAARPVVESFLIGARNGGVLAGVGAVAVVFYCAQRDRLRGLRKSMR